MAPAATFPRLTRLTFGSPFPSSAEGIRVQFARPVTGRFTFSDPSGSMLNLISFHVTDRDTVIVRVGSCSQWQAFTGPDLFRRPTRPLR